MAAMVSGVASAQNVTLFSEDFQDESTFGNYTIVDANADGKTWVLELDPFSGKGAATAKYSSANPSDDWLFLPAVNLKAGGEYTLSLDMYGGIGFCTEKAEIKIGTAATPEGMTRTIMESETFSTTSSNFTRTEVSFTADAGGEVIIGIHAISDKDMYGVTVDNIQLVGPAADGGGQGGEVETVSLPYTQDFSAENSFDGLTIINANDDNRQWTLKDGKAWLQYNGQNNSDDWLVLPAMSMSKDKAYTVKFDAWAHQGNFFPERIEVKYGNSPTAEAMTVSVLEPTVLTNKEDEPVHFECVIQPENDGIYYIGFHGISDKDQDGVFLDNIEVSEKSLSVPSEPADFTVTADPLGSNKATISLTAPSTDLSGNSITALTKVEILRGETLIHTFENPAPGEHLEYVDTEASRGLTTYTAVAYTADGRGSEAFKTLFVGINTPAPVPSVTVTESESKPGQVTLSWEVPTVDVDGNPINTDLITYEVVERNGIYSQTVIKSGIKATSYTYQAVPAGEPQQFKQWGVYSYTDNGTKHDTRTDLKAIGKPYDAPFAESFAGGETSSITDSKIDGVETAWTTFTDEARLGATAQDGDNGFSGFVTEDQGDFALLTMGKISLKDVIDPGLSFYIYNPSGLMGGIEDMFEVDIFTNNEWIPFYELVLKDLPLENAWNHIILPLDAYAGKTVQFRFLAGTVNGGLILVDNISVGRLFKKNIGATAVRVPAQVSPDVPFSVKVTVENFGTEVFGDDYTVTLSRNGKEIATLPGVAVGVAGESEITFTDKVNVAMDEHIYYTATVNSDSDENPADNGSRTATATLVYSVLPAPQMLETSVDGNTVTLTWQAPDMTELDRITVTESFELAESWAIDNVEGWTFIDGDGAETYSLQGYTYPGKNARMAYQVFDNAVEPFAGETGFDAVTGSKFLASFCSKAGKNDDWAISPELSGAAQTITLSASSFDSGFYSYLESFEILYSTSGTAVADFTLVEKVDEVPATWTDYSFNLPEGAKYFAIRCTSDNKYIFMVDDVTFSPKKQIDSDSFAGYNVYRDGERLNPAPVKALTYVDENVDKGDYTYLVTAVYGSEESGISNLATAFVAVASIDSIVVDPDGKTEIYDLMGRRLSAPVRGAVNIINGRKVYVK